MYTCNTLYMCMLHTKYERGNSSFWSDIYSNHAGGPVKKRSDARYSLAKCQVKCSQHARVKTQLKHQMLVCWLWRDETPQKAIIFYSPECCRADLSSCSCQWNGDGAWGGGVLEAEPDDLTCKKDSYEQPHSPYYREEYLRLSLPITQSTMLYRKMLIG